MNEPKLPTYRRWKTKGRDKAYSDFGGKRYYFKGEYDSPESRAAFDQLCDDIRSGAVEPGDDGKRPSVPAVFDLLDKWGDYCEKTFPATKSNRTAACNILALRDLAWLEHLTPHGIYLGDVPIANFEPEHLRAWIDYASSKKRKLSRRTIIDRLSRIKTAFRWGKENKLVPPGVMELIRDMKPPRKGRSGAIEKPPIKPAEWRDVEPVFAELKSPLLRAALWLQWFTGARTGSIIDARPSEFSRDKQSGVLLWQPGSHKGQWRDDDLTLPIGPKCEAILAPLLKGKATERMFVPKGHTAKGEYRHWTYRQALIRAQERVIEARKAERAKLKAEGRDDEAEAVYVPQKWTPHQIRHAKGTDIRDRYGVEAAQAVLGHESITATQIYAKARLARAIEIAKAEG